MLNGPSRGEGLRLTHPLTIGRDEHCDLPLEDPAVSRQHARLEPDGEAVAVIDLGSHNGTFVDGRPMARALLEGGCVRVGDTILQVSRLSEQWVAASPEGPLVGGTALAPVRRAINLAGPADLSVLITGETGTGKEIVARLLHEASKRRGPFIPVNCAALPSSLLESELFGHVRGAFTGATSAREGLFVTASGGTLFLDEVGDMPLDAQTKLLRVLEDGVVRPVGSEKGKQVDVRVVSATNRDLSERVEAGDFRADLLARLAGVEAQVPPLRSRREDLPALASYLLQRAGLGALEIAPSALEALLLHEWPMNARELESVLRTAALGGTDRIRLESLPETVRDTWEQRRRGSSSNATDERGRSRAPRERLVEALRTCNGNVRRASSVVGLSRSHVYRLLNRWNLDPNAFRGGRGATGDTLPPPDAGRGNDTESPEPGGDR